MVRVIASYPDSFVGPSYFRERLVYFFTYAPNTDG